MNIFKKFALFSLAIFSPLLTMSFLSGFNVFPKLGDSSEEVSYTNQFVFSFDYSKQSNKMTITYSNDLFLYTILGKTGYQNSSAYQQNQDEGVKNAIDFWASKLLSKDEVKNAFFEIDAINKTYGSKEVLANFPVTGDYSFSGDVTSVPKIKQVIREITANKDTFDLQINLNLSEPRLPVVPPDPTDKTHTSYNFIDPGLQHNYEDFRQQLLVDPNEPSSSVSGFSFKVNFTPEFNKYFGEKLIEDGDAAHPAIIQINNSTGNITNVWGIIIGVIFFCLAFITLSPALIFILKKF